MQFNLLLEIIFNLQKSSDTHYEQHLAQHIQQGKWFRCQSCRLVFETETSRNRHELEMHGRQKWTVPEAHPKVPTNVKGFYSFVKKIIQMKGKSTKTNSQCREILHDIVILSN